MSAVRSPIRTSRSIAIENRRNISAGLRKNTAGSVTSIAPSCRTKDGSVTPPRLIGFEAATRPGSAPAR